MPTIAETKEREAKEKLEEVEKEFREVVKELDKLEKELVKKELSEGEKAVLGEQINRKKEILEMLKRSREMWESELVKY